MPTLRAAPFPSLRDLAGPGDPDAPYVRSYLISRTLVGVLGILLPVALFAGEAFGVPGPVRVRDSLSAYYHTGLQDLFVGALCVIAFLLLTYLAGGPRTWDFWASSAAGVALLVVVAFPTARSGLPPGAPPCGSTPQPPGCSPVEQALGEAVSERVHDVAAVVAFLALAAVSFLFARGERLAGRRRAAAAAHVLLGVVMLAAEGLALAGTLAGLRFGSLTALYVGEVAALWAFGASWLLAGRDLWLRLLGRPRGRDLGWTTDLGKAG
jgi:hypothetical protein